MPAPLIGNLISHSPAPYKPHTTLQSCPVCSQINLEVARLSRISQCEMSQGFNVSKDYTVNHQEKKVLRGIFLLGNLEHLFFVGLVFLGTWGNIWTRLSLPVLVIPRDHVLIWFILITSPPLVKIKSTTTVPSPHYYLWLAFPFASLLFFTQGCFVEEHTRTPFHNLSLRITQTWTEYENFDFKWSLSPA